MLPVTNIQRFSTQDGPGIRTVVFLKGCLLRCRWCHNPEAVSEKPQILYADQHCMNCGACMAVCKTGAHSMDTQNRHCFDVSKCTGCLRCTAACVTNAVCSAGTLMSVTDIMEEALKDKAFYGTEGGITLSGGEPLSHMEECLSILRMAKKNGLSTVVETSGYFDESYIKEIAGCTDLFLWDFKDGNDARHRRYTGVSNMKIKRNLFLLDKEDCKIRLRCIMVKGVTMDDENYRAIAETYNALRHGAGIELLPYHGYGGSKSKQLGFSDSGRREWIPTPEDMKKAEAIIKSRLKQ